MTSTCSSKRSIRWISLDLRSRSPLAIRRVLWRGLGGPSFLQQPGGPIADGLDGPGVQGRKPQPLGGVDLPQGLAQQTGESAGLGLAPNLVLESQFP